MNKSITREELERLLERLDQSRDVAAEKLLTLRRKLAVIFERKMLSHVDALVDETVDRLAAKLATEDISSISAYAHSIAMNICKEAARNERKVTFLDETTNKREAAASDSNPEQQVIYESEMRRKQECLQKCLSKLSLAERGLILEYYVGDKQARISQRRSLAQRLELTIEALRVKTNTIRAKLRQCFDLCIGMKTRNGSARKYGANIKGRL